MPVTSAQVRMARAALNWSVRDLAQAAQVHRNTVTNIETGRYAGDPTTLAAIVSALKRAGVEFIEENGGGPGIRLKKKRQKKKRKIGANSCNRTMRDFGFGKTKPNLLIISKPPY